MLAKTISDSEFAENICELAKNWWMKNYYEIQQVNAAGYKAANGWFSCTQIGCIAKNFIKGLNF